MNKIRSLTQKQLFLPIFCVFLVLCSNIIYDIAQGNAFYNFFSISIKNGVLYGRIIDILNRGSEVAILAPPVKAYFKKRRAVKAAAAEKEAVTA
ncbi:MAG: hypothetical protein U0M53_11850 [Oscillospiraceae bacterium]|nr:hypothetical protein [Oscillospiraceae bacterium]